jgi:serine/threonine protein kinase
MLGQVVSHYRILERIGGGGMGVICKAKDTKLGRFVSLKFLPPHFTADADERKRFVHEAKAASALQHTNICTIHDIDETPDGQMFIVMDYYEGETLKKKIESGVFSLKDVVNIGEQIAEGLEVLHTEDFKILHDMSSLLIKGGKL